MITEPDILYEVADGIAVATLNRPAALNALTLGMVRDFHPVLDRWAADPAVRAVVVRGAGERAFCAGGDIRALYDGRGTGFTADFFREEYRLNRAIFRYPKPYIALMDGITMGGGVGVSVHARHRVVSEATVFAMPETGIGLFPDVGGAYFLPRMPGETGLYLALTGERMRAADCLYTGIGDLYVPDERHDALIAALRGGGDIAGTLDAFAGDAGAAPLADIRDAIDRCFSADSVDGVIAALESRGDDWAARTLAAMAGKSPTSQKVALRQIRTGATLDFEDCMRMEYRLSQRIMAAHDFFEGVRAVVIDKDQSPEWRPGRLTDVRDDDIDAYFAPLGDRELSFEQ
jgi:enoyl-CoA hydratase